MARGRKRRAYCNTHVMIPCVFGTYLGMTLLIGFVHLLEMINSHKIFISELYFHVLVSKHSEMHIWSYSAFLRTRSTHAADAEDLNAARWEALLSCYRYLRSLLERILTALTSRTLIIRNCLPDDNTLRMRAFLKNQTRLSHLSEVSLPNEMEMRRGESPHRSTVLMNKRKPIIYFQKRRRGNKGE